MAPSGLAQLGITPSAPLILYEDNNAAIMFSDHPGDHRKTKHIDTRRHFSRDAVHSGSIRLVFVPTDQQLPDGLTKALPPQHHMDLCLPKFLVGKRNQLLPQA